MAIDTALILGISLFGIIACCVGYRRRKSKTVFDTENIDRLISQNHKAVLLGRITYHGGLPQMPKPSVLGLGVTTDHLLMYDSKGYCEKVLFSDWLEFDNFIILEKSAKEGRSTALLGPLVPFLFKDKFRYFITIRHIDVNQEENNIILETGDKTTQQQICEGIRKLWPRHRHMKRYS